MILIYTLQKEALELCESLLENIRQVESMTDLEVVTPDVEDAERRQLHLVTRDVVHQYFMFGFEVCMYVRVCVCLFFRDQSTLLIRCRCIVSLVLNVEAQHTFNEGVLSWVLVIELVALSMLLSYYLC